MKKTDVTTLTDFVKKGILRLYLLFDSLQGPMQMFKTEI